MKRNKEWITLLMALGAAIFLCGACLYRIALTPGTSSAEGVEGLKVVNLGLGTKKDTILTRERVSEIVSCGLYQGNCLVGVDIPAGIYRVTTQTGGRTQIAVYENGELQETIHLADEEGTPIYQIVAWNDGQNLIVTGDDAWILSEANVEYEKIEYSGSYRSHGFYLYVGEYIVGRDVPAGNYDFGEWGDERVRIESTHPYEGGISFAFDGWTENDRDYYQGVRLQEGDVLKVESDVDHFGMVQVSVTIP